MKITYRLMTISEFNENFVKTLSEVLSDEE